MKILSKIFIFLFILCCFLFEKAQAIETKQTTITFANVNNEEYFDIEIMQKNDGEFLLPTKQIAEILEIPLKINHSTKDLTFEDIKISKAFVYKNGVKISKNQNEYLQKGMMEDIKDEIYCDEKILSDIFSSKITLNKSDLSVLIETNKTFSRKIVQTVVEKEIEKPFKTYFDVKKPKEKRKLTLDTIGFDNSMMSDSAVQIYKQSKDKQTMFSNTGRLKLKGEAYNGDWEADISGNNYKDKLFSFSGLSCKYKKNINDKTYEFGKITGFTDENYQLGSSLIGIQIYDYDTQKNDLRKIEGEIDKKSLVSVYINDEFKNTLNTYDGYYSLADFYCNVNKIEKVELKELKEDGEEYSILVKNYPKHHNEGFELKEKEKRHSLFVGISGVNDRLFAQNGYLYEMNSKKFTVGAQEQYGLRENLFFDTKILYDKIISQPKEAIWAQNYYDNNSILSMGTYKNSNILEGLTLFNSINWRINDRWKLSSDFAISSSKI